MKPIPDCVPDALNMIIDTAKAVSDDEFIHRKVLLKVMGELAEDGNLGTNPADLHLQCWETACRALGVKDPYENAKARANKTALGILKSLETKYPPGDERGLGPALRISFAGAIMDFTGLGRSDMEEKLAGCIGRGPGLDESDALIAAVEKAESVVLVANRAGEIVLDKPLADLMAAMGKTVHLAVAARPVFTMALERDAEAAGFSGGVTVVNPGTAMYGLAQERASSEFRDLMSGAGVVIAKGGVHFSTMSPRRELFFILGALPEDAAARLGVRPRDGAIVRMPASAE